MHTAGLALIFQIQILVDLMKEPTSISKMVEPTLLASN